MKSHKPLNTRVSRVLKAEIFGECLGNDGEYKPKERLKMTSEEAKKYAKTMSFEDALNNLRQARCVPYKRATLIKLNELLDLLIKRESELFNGQKQ